MRAKLHTGARNAGSVGSADDGADGAPAAAEATAAASPNDRPATNIPAAQRFATLATTTPQRFTHGHAMTQQDG